MTIEEFSNGFDVLLSSYNQQRIYGITDTPLDLAFNEYEKSVFLTESQKLIVRETYENPTTGASFESKEKIRRALNDLVKQHDFKMQNKRYANILTDRFVHTIYDLNTLEDCWFIIYEQAKLSSEEKCLNDKIIEVVPVKHDEYVRIRENPFRGPSNSKALRLDNGNSQVEIVSTEQLDLYTIRYVSMPKPIILIPLESNLAIQEETEPCTCTLHSSIHQIILQRAVQLAVESKLKFSKNNNNE